MAVVKVAMKTVLTSLMVAIAHLPSENRLMMISKPDKCLLPRKLPRLISIPQKPEVKVLVMKKKIPPSPMQFFL